MGMCKDFLISPGYELFLNVLVFNVWLPKEEKEKNEGACENGSASSLNPLKVT